jgi:hypothetical protein
MSSSASCRGTRLRYPGHRLRKESRCLIAELLLLAVNDEQVLAPDDPQGALPVLPTNMVERVVFELVPRLGGRNGG